MLSVGKTKFKITLPARASVWYTIVAFFERSAGVIFTPIFTRLLTPSEYGVYSLYTSWLGVFTVIASLEITGGVVYRGLLKFKSEIESYISSALGLLILSTLISLTLYLTFGRRLNDLTGLTTGITLLLFFQILLAGIENLYMARLKFHYTYKSHAAISLTIALLSPLLSIMLIKATRLGGVSRIIAPIITSAAVAVPIFFIILKKSKRLFRGEFWRFILKFNLPLLPHFLALSVIAQAGKIIIGRYLGGAELGKYSVAFSAGFIVSLVTYGISSALQPWINRKLISCEERRINDTAEALFSLAVISTLSFFCIIPEIFSIFASREYYEAIGAVYPIAISVVISFLTSTVSTAISYYEKNLFLTISSVSIAALSVSLNLFAVPRLGYIAAALIQLFSSFLMLFLSYFTLRLILKKELFLPREYLKYILLILLFSLLLYLFRGVFLSRALILTVLIMIILPLLDRCKSLICEK